MILIKKIINFILILVFLFSSFKVISKLNEYKKADNIYNELQNQKNNVNKEADNEDSVNEVIDLSNINSDYIGWIEIPGTKIDYPILQSDDNNYYINRDIYKNYLASGSIFLDYRNNSNFLDDNSVIYGHAMKNNTMFGELKKFKEKSFFDENNIIKILKPNGEILKYKIFSVYVTSASENYTQANFDNDAEYQNFLNKIVNESMFKSNESIKVDDKILTLSTCSFEFDDARTVIHAKLIS